MISRDQFDRVDSLLADGRSYREIQQATGIARDTIAKIRRGEIERPSICDGCKPAGLLAPVGRCDGCGRRIALPCCACCAEKHRERGPRPIGEIILDELDLQLRPGHAQRLEDVRAARRLGLDLDTYLAHKEAEGE